MSNVTINAKNIINIDAKRADELHDIEIALTQAFCRYDVPYSWIITTADLLHRYEILSGKKYSPNFPEDSIV